MSLPLRPSLLPQCTSCLRRLANAGLQEWRPAQQQVRGKKKLANKNMPSTISVRLLKPVKTFGRRGAIVPISVGQMRNEWFPRGTAEYVTDTQLRELKTKKTPMERDFQYGVEDTNTTQQAAETVSFANLRATKPARPSVQVERLTPERSNELLTIFLPPRLDFYRRLQPVEAPAVPEPTLEPTPEPTAPRQRRQQSASSAAADLLAARTQSPKPPAVPAAPAAPTAIFGSVSVSDVAVAMRAVMATNDEAARVAFGPEDIRFLNTGDEGVADRVKRVGEFEVEIKVRGAETGVRRLVRVLPQDVHPAPDATSGSFSLGV